MDVDERFQTILQECRWVRDPGTAARLVPALGAEAPAFVMLPQRGGEVRASVPIVCVSMLAGPVAHTIVSAVNGEGGGFENLDTAGVAADPLAAAMASIFAQCALPGLRSQATPALAVTWCTWEVLSGRSNTLPGIDDALGQATRTAAARVAAASGTARAELLQAIGWALVSRIAGGLSLAGMSGAEVVTGGLYRQILSNPLLLGYPRGTLEAEPGQAAPLLGLSLEPALVQAGLTAASALLVASRKRLEAGKAEPLDVALQAVIPADTDPSVAALHPTAGPALIAALPVLSTAKDLQKAGVDKRFAKGLVSARGARAMASAWRTLSEALGTWDVLSSLVNRVVPLQEQEGRMFGPGGALPIDARWPLLLPRPNASGTVQAVVAVRLTELRESLLGALHSRPWSLLNIRRTFDQVARANGASVRQVIGDCAVCTFPAPELALRFALLVQRAIGPDAGLELGDDGSTIPVPPTSAIGIGLALGVVEGGTDGERAHLSGRAVAEAVALAGNGRAARLHDDGVGVRQAGWGGGGFLNEGIVASDAFVRTVLDRTRRRNRPAHVRGEGGVCGGVGDDFALAPVSGWWEAGDDLVASALLIDSESMEGVAEIRVMSSGDFKEWFASDKSAAALRRPSRSSRSSAPAGGGFASTPSDDHSSAAPDFDAPSESFTGGGLDEPSMSFMGGGASPLRAPMVEEPTGEVTTDPTTADGFLATPEDVEDEDSGFGFVMEDDSEESDVGGYSMTDAPEPTSAPTGPAPPMMLLDDEDADDQPSGPSPRVAAPMMLMDDDDSGEFGFALSDDSEPPRGPAPPMMLVDDDEPPAAAPPMMMLDDEEDDAPVGGLLGDVQGDPFAREEIEDHVGLEPADSAFGPSGEDTGGGMSLLHATYQGEMELVGVAGFSLAGEDTAQGSDPFHDPSEDTGFFDERMSAHPRRPGARNLAGSTPAPPPPSNRPPDGAMVRELVRLLRGYVVVHDGSNHTFGLPDQGLLRDAWSHEGTASEAYIGFLRSKVAEGFIPRADRVVALVPGVRPDPIDADAIERAAGEAGL